MFLTPCYADEETVVYNQSRKESADLSPSKLWIIHGNPRLGDQIKQSVTLLQQKPRNTQATEIATVFDLETINDSTRYCVRYAGNQAANR